MTANKFAGYSYDAISNTLTMTAAFAKKASQLNTAEYNIVRQLRNDNPGMKIEKSAAKAPSKVQASPYKYVKTWFLNNYANYSEQPEFDADGFVIVKTKSQMEAEKKIAGKAQEQSFEKAMAEAKAQFEKVVA